MNKPDEINEQYIENSHLKLIRGGKPEIKSNSLPVCPYIRLLIYELAQSETGTDYSRPVEQYIGEDIFKLIDKKELDINKDCLVELTEKSIYNNEFRSGTKEEKALAAEKALAELYLVSHQNGTKDSPEFTQKKVAQILIDNGLVKEEQALKTAEILLKYGWLGDAQWSKNPDSDKEEPTYQLKIYDIPFHHLQIHVSN